MEKKRRANVVGRDELVEEGEVLVAEGAEGKRLGLDEVEGQEMLGGI